MLDPFGRQVDYMRISITDRCNERCAYCMPEGFSDWLPKSEVLTYEEVLTVARVAAEMGFRRFRVTGGEPLVRRDVASFVERLCAIPGVEHVSMTTNGTRLSPVARRLRDAGMRSVNISLDSLDPRGYHEITRGRLDEALAGIDAAVGAGFESVKLNVVLMKGLNEGQLYPIAEYAAERGIAAVRYIELMPVSDLNMIGEDRFLSNAAAMEILRGHDTLRPLPDARLGAGPAKYWKLEKLSLTVGFIGAMTDEHFCRTCNKVRLTADGFLRPCLGNHGEHDLKPALRNPLPFGKGQGVGLSLPAPLPLGERPGEGLRDDARAAIRSPSPAPPPEGGELERDHAVAEVLSRALAEKPLEHIFRDQYTPLRIMTAIGG